VTIAMISIFRNTYKYLTDLLPLQLSNFIVIFISAYHFTLFNLGTII